VGHPGTSSDDQGRSPQVSATAATTGNTVRHLHPDCKSVGLRPRRRIVHVQWVPDAPAVGAPGVNAMNTGEQVGRCQNSRPRAHGSAGSATQARGMIGKVPAQRRNPWGQMWATVLQPARWAAPLEAGALTWIPPGGRSPRRSGQTHGARMGPNHQTRCSKPSNSTRQDRPEQQKHTRVSQNSHLKSGRSACSAGTDI
jgi:hypothetical protein